MSKHNNNCDGAHCTYSTGEVRLLPSGGDSNMILCRACFEYEIRWRKEQNPRLCAENKFHLPEWETLEVYRGAR